MHFPPTWVGIKIVDVIRSVHQKSFIAILAQKRLSENIVIRQGIISVLYCYYFCFRYYTNHSTKYAKYVKYHAARILVYMGLFHRLGGRVDLFDTKCK